MNHYWNILKRSHHISISLFKVMIPVMLLMKLLTELGLVELLASSLHPVMQLVGLPGEMGLVWATAMVTNLYGGLVVYAGLAAEVPMTVAQVTLISSMMLIAHALPVEGRIAQKAGVNIAMAIGFRVAMAILYALLMNWIYLYFNWLQEPANIAWSPSVAESSLLQWVIDQLIGLAIIYSIVLVLVTLLDLLRRIGVIDWINARMRPILHTLGIGREAETITLVGLTLGISYGGALLIEEAEKGHVRPLDVFFALSLLGLSHSLIEDTLLMLLIGADLSGILIGRVMFSLLVIFIMVRLVSRMPTLAVDRFLVRSVANAPAGSHS